MTGRTVLITGITSGIGRATALMFAKGGWNVAGHYFSSKKKADELREEIAACKVGCVMLKADFSSEKELMPFIGEIGRLGIDSLINNAGTYGAAKHFSEFTVEDLTKTFSVNAFAPVLIASRIFTKMKEKGWGRIVNISSIAAKYGGSANSLHYGCSKRAIEGLTRTLAREGARYNILVNTLRPGVTDTDFHRKFPKDMKKRIGMIPLGRMGDPVEVADVAFYLGSERNTFITSETVTVAGGE